MTHLLHFGAEDGRQIVGCARCRVVMVGHSQADAIRRMDELECGGVPKVACIWCRQDTSRAGHNHLDVEQSVSGQ